MGHISYFQNTILPMNISIARLPFSFILKSNFRNSPSLSLSHILPACVSTFTRRPLQHHEFQLPTSVSKGWPKKKLHALRLSLSLPLLLNKLRPGKEFRSSFLFVSFFIIQLVNLISDLWTLFLKILDISFFFINITNMAKYFIRSYKRYYVPFPYL